MRRVLIFLFLLLSLVLLIPGLSYAMAEEEGLKEGQVELYIDGKFPTQKLAVTSRSDLDEINAYLLEKLLEHEEGITLSSFYISTSKLDDIYENLLNNHPELFFVENYYSVYHRFGTVIILYPEYTCSAEELPSKMEAYNKSINAIASYANQASTTIGKLLRVNDYFCANFQYDTSYNVYSADQLFEQKKGVCQAYMLAYTAVMKKLGIPCAHVVSNEMNHTWNLVNVDGSWYHVDVTWNDPLYDTPYRAMHDNFLLSDAGIEAAGHSNWSTAYTATNTRFDDYFWRDLDHVIPVYGNLAYHKSNTSSYPDLIFSVVNLSSGDVNHNLPIDLSTLELCSLAYPPYAFTRTTIYFGLNDKVYSTPLEGGKPTFAFSLDDSSESMRYFFLSDNTLYTSTNRSSIHSFCLDEAANPNPEVSLDTDLLNFEISSSKRLAVTTNHLMEGETLLWSSSDESVITVDEEGLVTAVAPGIATVTVQVNSTSDEAVIIVHPDEIIDLPDNITIVNAESFANTAVIELILPRGTTSIEASAFANCTSLRILHIPDSVTFIAESAFDGCNQVTLLCTAGSSAEAYAIANDLPYVLY